MRTYGWFKEIYDEAKESFEFKLTGLELDITEKILEAMEKKKVNRKELADSLGVSKAAVSKLLNKGSNATLKTLLKVAEALDCELTVSIKAKEEMTATAEIEKEESFSQVYDPRPKPLNTKVSARFADGYGIEDFTVVNYA